MTISQNKCLVFSLFSALVLMVLIGCGPTKPKPVDLTQNPNSQSSNAGSPGPSSNGPSAGQSDQDWETQQRGAIEGLMKQGRMDEAVALIETMSTTAPNPQNLRDDIISTHLAYADYLNGLSTVSPSILNYLLFIQYSRVLQLDPENQAAKVGLEKVKAFYAANNLELPTSFDPKYSLKDALKDFGTRTTAEPENIS